MHGISVEPILDASEDGMLMNDRIASTVRRLTGSWVYRKRLPADFGRQGVFVTPRSDLRFLYPGLERIGRDLFGVVRRHVRPGAVVWDIGSNLGLFAFPAAMRAGRSGSVYSLEADPKYAALQAKTFGTMGDEAAPVSILCAAAADRLGIMELVIPRKGHSRNHLSVVEGNDAGEPEARRQVMAVTLDWLLDSWKRPDFVKVDVEGAERLVVEGARRLFTEVRPPAFIECQESNAEFLTGFFRGLGYRLFTQSGDAPPRPIERFDFNTLALPDGPGPG